MASPLSFESGQTFAIECQQENCDKENIPLKAGEVKTVTSVLGFHIERAGEEKKLRVGRDLKCDRKIQVKVDSTESDESEPRNHSEGKDSSKHEGSSNFEGKVAVTRSSSRRRLGVQPVTPRLEEPRAVRPNRGMKRRYPGDESDDNNSAPKRSSVRVRSISKVGSPNSQQGTFEMSCKGRSSIGKEWIQRVRTKRRGRQNEIFICNMEGCEKSFTDAVALYNHGRVHGDRPYVCHYEGCTKRFSERSKLKRHFLIHTGEKPFICNHEGCGKAFSLDFNLRSHMKTHTGEYHECPHAGCEKRYCQEYKLRAHICKEHKGTAKLKENGGVFSKEESVISSNDKAAKKKEKVEQMQSRRGKMEKSADGLKKRMKELQSELDGKSKELTKLEKAIRKLSREEEQMELELCLEQDHSSDNLREDKLGEVFKTEVYDGEEKEVVMLTHKLPTADQDTGLMNQVLLIQDKFVLIQAPTPPLSPSISSSQQSVLLPLRASSPSNRPINYLSCAPPTLDNTFFTNQVKIEQKNRSPPLISPGMPVLQDKPSDPQAGEASQALSPKCHNPQSISFLHEQNSQCEPPVSQLFTYQEQPCLHD